MNIENNTTGSHNPFRAPILVAATLASIALSHFGAGTGGATHASVFAADRGTATAPVSASDARYAARAVAAPSISHGDVFGVVSFTNSAR